MTLNKGKTYAWCACGHEHLSQFEHRDLSTWKKEMAELSGVAFAGVGL